MCFISLKYAVLKICPLMTKQKVTFSFLGRKVPRQMLYIRELLFNIIKNFKQKAKLTTHTSSHEDPTNSIL